MKIHIKIRMVKQMLLNNLLKVLFQKRNISIILISKIYLIIQFVIIFGDKAFKYHKNGKIISIKIHIRMIKMKQEQCNKHKIVLHQMIIIIMILHYKTNKDKLLQ